MILSVIKPLIQYVSLIYKILVCEVGYRTFYEGRFSIRSALYKRNGLLMGHIRSVVYLGMKKKPEGFAILVYIVQIAIPILLKLKQSSRSHATIPCRGT